MHPATKLLLARLESNPEEFVECISEPAYGANRWYRAISKLAASLPRDEWVMFEEKLHDAQLNQLHKDVMSALCDPPRPEHDRMLGTSENNINTVIAPAGAHHAPRN